jgi:hypothetical protein
MLTAISTNLTNGINNSTVIPDQMKQATNTAISQQTSNVEFGGGAHIPGNIPAVLKTEITDISHTAITDANKQALSYAIIFGFIGLISTIWLPGGTHIDFEENLATRKGSKA